MEIGEPIRGSVANFQGWSKTSETASLKDQRTSAKTKETAGLVRSGARSKKDEAHGFLEGPLNWACSRRWERPGRAEPGVVWRPVPLLMPRVSPPPIKVMPNSKRRDQRC